MSGRRKREENNLPSVVYKKKKTAGDNKIVKTPVGRKNI